MSNVTETEKFYTPVTSKRGLQAWLKKYIGLTLPDCKVTQYADSTPLDFVWDVYRAIIDGKSMHMMALAGRDSSKTVGLSIIDLLAMVHDQRGAIHLGMTKAQAGRAKDYIDTYIGKLVIIRGNLVKSNTTEVEFQFGQNRVGLELLAMSPKAVQGAHKALVTYDELASSVDPTHIKAYRDSSGIPGTSPKGKPAVIVKITSRQAGYSLAEQEIENAHKSGIKIVKWTTIDTMKKCPDTRSGTEDLPIWINIQKGFKYTDEEFEQLPEPAKNGFDRITTTKKGCHKCPLVMYCQGNARKQTSTSVLLRDIDDVIQKVSASNSHEWVLSQIMSLEPSKEGLVYFEFNRDIHIPGWNAMWKTLTGKDPVVDVTREQFVIQAKRAGATFVAGIDFGWSSPSTCVVLAIDKRDNIFVLDAIGRTFLSDPEWVETVKTQIHDKYDVQMYCPDSEDQGAIKLFGDASLPVVQIDKSKGSVKAGINTVKGFLKVPGTNNTTKLFIAPDIISTVTNVPGLLDEFRLYKKQTDVTGKILDDQNPEKGNDHYLDALRYVMFWYFGKATAKAVFSGGAAFSPGDPVNPLAEELARMQGVNFEDNRHEFKGMGYQESIKKPDPDDDDPDGSGGAGGSGLQVAWT